MTKKRKTYTREFKLEALELAETNGRPIAHIEGELGLSAGLLHHWKRQLADDGEEAFPGKGRLRAQDELILH